MVPHPLLAPYQLLLLCRRCSVILHRVDLPLNLDSLLTAVRDYFQRALEELLIRGPVPNPRDNPEMYEVREGREGGPGCGVCGGGRPKRTEFIELCEGRVLGSCSYEGQCSG